MNKKEKMLGKDRNGLLSHTKAQRHEEIKDNFRAKAPRRKEGMDKKN